MLSSLLDSIMNYIIWNNLFINLLLFVIIYIYINLPLTPYDYYGPPISGTLPQAWETEETEVMQTNLWRVSHKDLHRKVIDNWLRFELLLHSLLKALFNHYTTQVLQMYIYKGMIFRSKSCFWEIWWDCWEWTTEKISKQFTTQTNFFTSWLECIACKQNCGKF